jgi:hypothetical protein
MKNPTLKEVKDIRDKAEAIRKYAAVSGAGLDIQNAGAELKLRAERKGGEICLVIDREPGKRTDLTSLQSVTRLQDVAKEADIDRMTIARWEQQTEKQGSLGRTQKR